MRLLLINPNISDSVSTLIDAEARRSAAPGTAIRTVTARSGVAYIETRFEAMLGAQEAARLAAEFAPQADAVIVAAFGDPGVRALREVLPCPVLGITEAALASAMLLGQRFSIIAISERICAWYRETVDSIGLLSRLASIRALDEPLASIASVQEDQSANLLKLCERAVAEDGADVLVIAGAPLAGLARSLRHRLPVPCVDGISSAVRHAESLHALSPGTARRGSFARPPEKLRQGIDPSLDRLFTAKPR